MESDTDWIADCCDEFEDAWHAAQESAATPDLESFFGNCVSKSTEPNELTNLISELSQIDMEFRWRFAPEAVVSFSTYIAKFDQLDDVGSRLDLAVSEFRIRQMWSEKPPQLDEFLATEQLAEGNKLRFYTALQEIEPLEIVVTPASSEQPVVSTTFDCPTEAANALGTSVRTAERTWTFAKSWLLQAIEGND